MDSLYINTNLDFDLTMSSSEQNLEIAQLPTCQLFGDFLLIA